MLYIFQNSVSDLWTACFFVTDSRRRSSSSRGGIVDFMSWIMDIPPRERSLLFLTKTLPFIVYLGHCCWQRVLAELRRDMQRILEATHPAQYCCAAQQSNSIHFLNVLASLAFKLSVSQSRGVIGDIIHYFTLMSLKLTLFLDIIHYFFKGTKIMPLFLKKFQKLLIILIINSI